MSLFPQYVAYEGPEQPPVANTGGFLSSLTGLLGGVLQPAYATYQPANQLSTSDPDVAKLKK